MKHPVTIQIGRRHLLLVGAALVVLLLIAPVTVWAVMFTDVPAGHTHAAGIGYAADKGIALGYADGTYKPDNPITRGQMATFMYRSSGNDPATAPSVNAAMLGGKQVGQLVAAGIHVTRGAGDAPVVDRWFNNVNGAAPTIGGSGGSYDIDVGFATNTRFALAVVDTNFVDTRDAFATVSTPGGNIVRVRIWDVSAAAQAPAEFWVYVYGS